MNNFCVSYIMGNRNFNLKLTTSTQAHKHQQIIHGALFCFSFAEKSIGSHFCVLFVPFLLTIQPAGTHQFFFTL